MEFRLSTPNSMDGLHDLSCAVAAVLQRNQVPRSTIDDVLLIAEEIIANAITHGFAGSDSEPGELRVSVRAEHDLIHLEFRDNGKPFNPLDHPPPDLDADIVDRPIGGLGIHLIRELSEAVSYARQRDYNVFSCALRRPESAGDPHES